MAWLGKIFRSIGVWIDTAVYELVDLIYRLFLMIAEAGIFTPETIQEFATRIYAFLGLIMVFKVSVALVTYIMNPDNFTKGEVGGPALLKGFFIALVGIVAVPYVFEAAFSLQRIVLANNIIGNIILGIGSTSEGNGVGGDYIDRGGELMASTALRAFYKPNDNLDGIDATCVSDPGNCSAFIEKFDSDDQDYVKDVFSADPIVAGDILDYDISLATVKQDGKEMFVMSRMYFLTWICGLFIAYILLLFCFDIAVRSVKLSFLQLIAPIPLLARIDPKKGKKTFENWIKECVTTYLDLFVRLLTIYFALFLISSLSVGAINVVDPDAGFGGWGWLVTVFLMIGILNFVRDLPKLLSSLLGIDFKNMGGFSLNPMKNKNTAPLGIGASAIGGLANARRNNLNNANAKKDWMNNWMDKQGQNLKGLSDKEKRKRAKAAWNTLNDEDRRDAGHYGHYSYLRAAGGSLVHSTGAFMSGKNWGDLASMQRERMNARDLAIVQGAETRGIIREMVSNITGGLTQQQQLQIEDARLTKQMLDKNEDIRTNKKFDEGLKDQITYANGEIAKTDQATNADALVQTLAKFVDAASKVGPANITQVPSEISSALGWDLNTVKNMDISQLQSVLSHAEAAKQAYLTKFAAQDYINSEGTKVRDFIIDGNGDLIFDSDLNIADVAGPGNEVRKSGKIVTKKDGNMVDKNNAVIEAGRVYGKTIVMLTPDGNPAVDANGDVIEMTMEEIAKLPAKQRKEWYDNIERINSRLTTEIYSTNERKEKIKAETPKVTAEHNYAETTWTGKGGGK